MALSGGARHRLHASELLTVQCATCGTEVRDGSLFCSFCGSRLDGSQTGRRRPSAESIATGEQRLLKALRDATLGEYEILGEIGRGGMAVVFLAHDVGLNRRVAIKVMSPTLLLMDEGIQARFKREAQTAASLSHPHIIPVHAVRQSSDLVFFVMKYVVGRSLESVIKEVGPLPLPVIKTVFNQAGSALAHAHKNGVIHRDIKPGNIMLDEDGWVVVADFGIAKVAEAEALTMTGGMVGTPAYMSPEQCSGSALTGAADQYSLGVVAYEMVTGRQPFQGGTMVNLIYDHCHTAPPPITDARPDCPPELAAAVMRMLAKDPTDRFPSIDDAMSAIGYVSDTQQEVVRTHMLTLAQRSETDRLLEKFNTPGSPAPPSGARPPRQEPASTPVTPAPYPPPAATPVPAPASRVPTWAWAVPAVALTAVVTWLMVGRSSTPPTTPPQTVVAAAPAVVAIDVQPLSAVLSVGETLQLDATPRTADGTLARDVEIRWESSNPTVASVAANGSLTGHAAGTARIAARVGGNSATIVATVTAPPPAARPGVQASVSSVNVAPSSLTLSVGDRARVLGVAADASGAAVANQSIAWRSADPSIATVASSGDVVAVAAGTTQITATASGRTGSVTVTVTPQAVASIEVSPAASTLTVGESLTLRAVPRDAQGRTLTDRQVTWESSAPAVARVGSNGVVTAASAGTATISASANGRTDGSRITVSAAAPTPPAAPARNDRAEIDQALEVYRRAIESRDLQRLRAAYPGMTAEQERAWRGFFGSVSELTATFSGVSVNIDGDSAVAQVAAVYAFHTNRDESRNLNFVIALRRAATGWTLTSVR